MICATALMTAMTACSDPPSLSCVDRVDFATCGALYAPTWDNVYTNTIVRGCSTGGGSCHAHLGRQGGLDLEGSDQAYRALVDGHYVLAGNAACSPMVERLYTSDPTLVMPRGARLNDAEACAVGKWVAAGAPGPIDAGVAP